VSDERDHQRLEKDRRTYRLAGIGNRSFTSIADDIGHVDDLVAGYVLGALEADESSAVDAHVRTCPPCQASLADAQRTASMLPFVVPMQKPPIDSKVALFARVAHAQRAAATSTLPVLAVEAWRTPTLPSSAGVALAHAGSATSSSAVAGESSSRGSRSGWLVSVLSVPLLIALVVTGFWGLQLQNQLSSQNAQLTELQSELANFGSGMTSYPLSPGFEAPQAEGQIVIGSDGRAGMLQVDVNSKDAAGAYELWVNQDGKLVPAAEFTVDQDGIGQARFELDQPFGEYESVHIRAKALDPNQAGSQSDTLVRDSSGALGSTGSGLDIIP
jgi:Putative zinc-finger